MIMETVEKNKDPGYPDGVKSGGLKTEGGQTSRGPMEIRPMTEVTQSPTFLFPQRPDK